MKGTIIPHQPKQGKKTFGYSVFLGRDADGKQIRQVKRGFATKKKAEKALREAVEAHEQAPASARSMPTFREFFERWNNECVEREYAPKTAERTYEFGQYAVRLFGDVLLSKLDTMQLASAMNQLSDRGGQITQQHRQGRPLAPKTVRHIAFTVQACLEQAVDWEILAKNPMKKVKKPKVPRRRPKVIDRGGFDRLLEKTAGTSVYPVIVLAMATGMRRGELCAVEWGDIDWDKATLEVSKSLEETRTGPLRVKCTKSGETRRFSLPLEVLEILRDHHRDQQHDREMYGPDYANRNLVFARPDGEFYSPDKLGTRIRSAMQATGLHGVSLHSLRHSHASELLSQRVPITAVSERLGHASPNITLGIYSHALPADNEAAAKLWNDAMGDVLRNSRKQVRGGGLSLVITEPEEKPAIPLKSAS